jgi:hypothetical protein
MLDSFLKRVERRIEAGGRVKIPGVGEKIFVERATIAFKCQADDRMEFDLKRRASIKIDPFNAVTIHNPHATKTLTVVLWIGRGEAKIDELSFPSTEVLGHVIETLADEDEIILPGIDSDGRTREQLTITLRPGVAGRIEVYNDDDDSLLAIVAAGGSASNGIALRTDCNIKIKNMTGGALSSETDPRDIAVAESWFAND